MRPQDDRERRTLEDLRPVFGLTALAAWLLFVVFVLCLVPWERC